MSDNALKLRFPIGGNVEIAQHYRQMFKGLSERTGQVVGYGFDGSSVRVKWGEAKNARTIPAKFIETIDA